MIGTQAARLQYVRKNVNAILEFQNLSHLSFVRAYALNASEPLAFRFKRRFFAVFVFANLIFLQIRVNAPRAL